MKRTTKTLTLLTATFIAGLTGRAQIELTPSDTGTKSTQPTTTTTGAAIRDADLLKFRNLDTFHGEIISVTPDTGLRWRRTDVHDPIKFDLTNLWELQLAPRPPRTERTPHRMAIELTNGDRLAGDVVSLNDKTLTLNTWYAGTLQLKRPMLQRMTCNITPQNAAYVGPTGIEDWTAGEGNQNAWKFKKGALYSSTASGTIGRDVNLPDIADIEFDLAWRGQLYFNVSFYTDNLREVYRSSAYLLQISGSSMYLNRQLPNRGSNNMGGGAEIQKFRNNSKAHIAIKVNKPQKTITVFVDNTLIKQWTDGDEFAGKGKGIAFFSQGSSYQVRVSNIVVSHWDGKMDTDETGTAAGTTDDTVRLANNDKVSGTITGITKGELILKTSFADMKIPLERVLQVDFASAKSERPRRQANDIRAFFLDGSRFTLNLEKLDEQTLTGTTENCGSVKAAIDAFSRVQFHIYEPAPETDDDDDWDAKPGIARAGRGRVMLQGGVINANVVEIQ